MMGTGKEVNRALILETLGVILEPWLDGGVLLNEDSNLLLDVGLDSVAILQLILGIEKRFDIKIDDGELDSQLFSKVRNLIDIVEGKIHEAD